MRLPNGMGTAFKMPGKHRKPWRAMVTLGCEEGKYIRKTIGYFEESKDAIKALALYDKNVIIPKSDLTLQNMYDEWYQYEAPRMSKAKAKSYHAGWLYLAPLYNANFREIRAKQMQKIIDDAFKTKSQSTVKNILTVLKKVFEYGFEHDIVIKNYAGFLKLPQEDVREKKAFNDLQIKSIEASKNEWAESVLVLIYTGLRISELLGLTKFNIDVKDWIIKGGIKTEAGKNRIIPIHPKIQPIIKKWIDQGGTYLIEYKGKKIRPDDYRSEYFKPLMVVLGIENMTPHNCRHTCASILSKNGADTISIQRIMGHASYSTTADVYTHTDLDQLRNAISKL